MTTATEAPQDGFTMHRKKGLSLTDPAREWDVEAVLYGPVKGIVYIICTKANSIDSKCDNQLRINLFASMMQRSPQNGTDLSDRL